MKNLLRSAVVAAPLLALGVLAPPASADLTSDIQSLTVEAEQSSGYDRDALNINYDRDEILADNKAAFDSCDGYFSRYNGQCHGSEDDVQIDHLLAVKEAWDSGLRGDEKWEEFDGDTANLTVMTSGLNQDKSDKDPADWTPKAATCHYVQTYVNIKAKYGLTVDQAEKQALVSLAADCGSGGNGGNQDGDDNNGGNNDDGQNGDKNNGGDSQDGNDGGNQGNNNGGNGGGNQDGDDTQNGGQQDNAPAGNSDDEGDSAPSGNDQINAIPEGGVQTGGGGTAGNSTGLIAFVTALLVAAGGATAVGARRLMQRN